jgi:predicted ATP-grasp superfamily ATP-dependent carboligase
VGSALVAVSGAATTHGLAAIRDLGRGGHEVVGTTFRPIAFNARSRWSRRYLTLPSPRDAGALLEALARAEVQALLPMESSLVGTLSRHESEVQRRLSVAIPPLEGFLDAYDNRRTLERCQRLGIPAPRLFRRPEDARGMVVVKPREDVGSARGVAFCRDAGELGQALAACRALGEPVVQEYVPGDTQAMRTVVLLFDRKTRLVAHFTTQKLEQYPATGGVTAMSVSTDERELVELVLPFFDALRWRGPAEVELKVDARDGQAKVIEVNPRLPGYVGFAVACGLHLPRLAVQVALGETPIASGYAVGCRYVHPGLHAKAVIHAWRTGALTGARLWREIPGLLTAPWLRWEDVIDPLPRLAKALDEVKGIEAGLPAEHRLRLSELEPLEAAAQAGSWAP